MTAKKRSRLQISFQDLQLINSQILPRTSCSDSHHQTARRDLRRYYELLIYSRPQVSRNVAGAICDAVGGWSVDSVNSANRLWAEIDDLCEQDGLAEKWKFPRRITVSWLRSLPVAACLSLIDSAERFWISTDEHRDVGQFFNIAK